MDCHKRSSWFVFDLDSPIFCDVYCGLVPDRAFGFADSAADAEVEVDVRLFDRHRFLPSRLLPRLLKPYRFRRCRTDLFTDDARCGMGIRKASSLVDHGKSELHLHLLFERQSFDGAGRTNLAAECTAVFTISDPGDKSRRPYAFEPCLKQCRLQAVRDAYLHALAALNATFRNSSSSSAPGGLSTFGFEYSRFCKGVDRAVALPGPPRRGKAPPAFCQDPWRGFALSESEAHCILRTDIITGKTCKTFGLFPSSLFSESAPP